MRSRSRLIVIPLFILVFGVVSPLKAGAQNLVSQSRSVEGEVLRTDTDYDILCYAFFGPSECPILSMTLSSDEDSDAAPDFLPWAGSVSGGGTPGDGFGFATQDSSITALEIEGSGTQFSAGDCHLLENPPFLTEVRESGTAKSRLDVEFDVSQPTAYSLLGEVNLFGSYNISSSSTAFVRLSFSGGPVLSETLVSEGSPCGEDFDPCSATEAVTASGILAPGLYRIEAEADGFAFCLDEGFNDSQNSDFDFELVLTPPVPLLDGVGVAILVGMMLSAGVYGSRGRRE